MDIAIRIHVPLLEEPEIPPMPGQPTPGEPAPLPGPGEPVPEPARPEAEPPTPPHPSTPHPFALRSVIDPWQDRGPRVCAVRPSGR